MIRGRGGSTCPQSQRSLAKSLASFATSGHVAGVSVTDGQSPAAQVYITAADQSQNRSREVM